VEIRSWSDVLTADRRTLAFMPGGLGVGLRMTEEGAADFQQRLIAELELAAEVGTGTRLTFERLRAAWVYGVLNYDLFTIISDAAWLVFEQAVREAFLEHHQNRITFVDPAGGTHVVQARRFDDVYDYARDNPEHRLQMSGQPAIEFDGGFTDLRRWARLVGRLRGQRARAFEELLGEGRNNVAHPDGYDLGSPIEASRTLADLREWINQLWGAPTAGGRRYPEPVGRPIAVFARHREGLGFAAALADELLHVTDTDGTPLDPHDDWEYAIARAVMDRPLTRHGDVDRFDSLFEVTPYPAHWLWGPGTRSEARQWLLDNTPQPDTCDVLDRTFAVRHDQGRLWQPMRPDVAAGLVPENRGGLWFLVRADFPEDAYLHVRNRVTKTGCTDKEWCRSCQKAQTLIAGVPFARAFGPVARTAATTGLPDIAWHGSGFLAEYSRSYPLDMPQNSHSGA
jgi:hypothetical protein